MTVFVDSLLLFCTKYKIPSSFLKIILPPDLGPGLSSSWVTFNRYCSITPPQPPFSYSNSIPPGVPISLQVCFYFPSHYHQTSGERGSVFCKQVLSSSYLQVTVPSILPLLTTAPQLCLLHDSASIPVHTHTSLSPACCLCPHHSMEAFTPKGTCRLPIIKFYVLFLFFILFGLCNHITIIVHPL